MKIELEIKLPYYSWTLDDENDGVPNDILYNGTKFLYSTPEKEREHKRMLVKISWEFNDDNIKSDQELKIKQANKGIEFLNHIIYHARTFDFNSIDITLISPRIIKNIVIRGLNNEVIEFQDTVSLNQNLSNQFELYFYEITDEGAFDAFSTIVEDNNQALLEINLLVDAYHAIYEGRYSEALINCMCAIETFISPILEEWLTEKLYNKNEKSAELVLREIPMNMKYELLFGSARKEMLQPHDKLLEKLKEITKLRNDVIHRGKRATKADAILALDASSLLINILYNFITPSDWEYLKERYKFCT